MRSTTTYWTGLEWTGLDPPKNSISIGSPSCLEGPASQPVRQSTTWSLELAGHHALINYQKKEKENWTHEIKVVVAEEKCLQAKKKKT